MSSVHSNQKSSQFAPLLPVSSSLEAVLREATRKLAEREQESARQPVSSHAELEAYRIRNLRNTPPKLETSVKGRERLGVQSNLAKQLLRVSSERETSKSIEAEPKTEESDSPNEGGGGLFSGLGGLLGQKPPPFPPTRLPEVDWDTLQEGDRIPASDEGGEDWVAVRRGSQLRLERAGAAADDGGSDWTEVLTRGDQSSSQQRFVSDPEGGPDWTETQGALSANMFSRELPAEDGGPAWTQVRWGESGQIQTSRQVPDNDGGAPWTEYLNLETGQYRRYRPEPADDELGDWHVHVNEAGEERRHRHYTDEQGREWSESINGENRWRQNVNAAELAKQQGPHRVLTVEGPNGPLEIQIYGATEEEFERIRESLEALPPAMRQFTSNEIVVAEEIGEILNADGTHKSRVAGFGGATQIILDRGSIGDRVGLDYVLYHEMGHVQDFNTGRPSSRPPWGDGNAVSPYGGTNALEDYAEAHRIALQNHDLFAGLTRETILENHPQGVKIVEILDSYNFEYGTGTEYPSPGGLPPLPPEGGGGLLQSLGEALRIFGQSQTGEVQ